MAPRTNALVTGAKTYLPPHRRTLVKEGRAQAPPRVAATGRSRRLAAQRVAAAAPLAAPRPRGAQIDPLTGHPGASLSPWPSRP